MLGIQAEKYDVVAQLGAGCTGTLNQRTVEGTYSSNLGQSFGRSRCGSGQLLISREERWMKQVNVLEAAHIAQKAKKPME